MSLLVDILAYWNFNDDGSGGVSFLDSTPNGHNLTAPNGTSGLSLGTGIIGGDASFDGDGTTYLSTGTNIIPSGLTQYSTSVWIKSTNNIFILVGSGGSTYAQSSPSLFSNDWQVLVGDQGSYDDANFSSVITNDGNWHNIVGTWNQFGNISAYVDGQLVAQNPSSGSPINTTFVNPLNFNANGQADYAVGQQCEIDECGIWTRELSPSEVTKLYNGGAGYAYPFPQTPTDTLYYNNSQEDGDWGNLLNWWQDSGFTIQATALPTSTNPINLYNQVTQNTQGSDQAFCASASFWSANFGAGLTLQSTGVVNMQGTSVMAGHTTDGVSMHDSSTLTETSVIDANVTMRDASRAFGYIGGNAYVYYDGGNGQYPIGGTVEGTVTYVGWPAVSPQWFNDQATGGGNNGDFSDLENWWSDDTYTTRPLSPITGQQYLPDASTDVFIAPNTGITSNSGTANPTVNSVTANNSNIQNISITATNGFLFSGNEGAQNATLYGSVTFQDTAYNYNSVIQGTVTYKSAASLQNSWNQNSLGNLNSGAIVGSTGFVVNISSGGGGGTALGTNWISRLLHLPWFINV